MSWYQFFVVRNSIGRNLLAWVGLYLNDTLLTHEVLLLNEELLFIGKDWSWDIALFFQFWLIDLVSLFVFIQFCAKNSLLKKFNCWIWCFSLVVWLFHEKNSSLVLLYTIVSDTMYKWFLCLLGHFICQTN